MTFAEQLKSRLDIVDVISQYVRLKRSGGTQRYIGLCPFHSERSPSFNVNAASQFYYCFGCQATGDVFKFVQEIESLTFPETLKTLAERNGIPVPQQRVRADDPEAQRRTALLEMHEIAAEVFQSNLRGGAGTEARQYLERRGVTKAIVDEFRLGLSDPSGQQLTQKLQRFGPELLEQSGLVKKRESGGFFDTFRGRLIFPIHSEQGNVIAFGGRALGPDDKPKYLNSPETAIYKKSTILYNFHRAKIDARKNDRIILVEGYMDAIGVYAAGIREVVAVCGTALSNEQVRNIKRQVAQQQASTGSVILNFDPDAAGTRSAEKYISHFLAEGMRVRLLELPDDLDPDEFIQRNGVAAYQQKLAGATSYIHWLAERARNKFDLQTVDGRVDAFKSILPAVQQVSDRIERSAVVAELATALHLDRDMIAEQLRQNTPRSEAGTRVRSATASVPPNELLLLTCLLLSEDARVAIKHYLANSSVLHILESRSVFEAALRTSDVFSIEAISKDLEPRWQRILADLSFSSIAVPEEDATQQAIHCLRALESKAQEAHRTQLRRRIRELEQEGNLEQALALMNELDRTNTGASR